MKTKLTLWCGLKFHKSRLHTIRTDTCVWIRLAEECEAKKGRVLAPLCCSGEARLKGLPGRRTVCLPKTTRFGRRIKQQRCSNELPRTDTSPALPSASRSPPRAKPTLLLSHPGTRRTSILRCSPPTRFSLFSSAAVKVGREVWCLRELREHSCLFQTGHPTPTDPPPLRPPQSILGWTKGTFICRGPGNLCGFNSACTHMHTLKKKKKSVCGKFVGGEQ